MKSGSNLEKALQAGKFVLTAELGPPKGASPEGIIRKAEYFRGFVDAVNVTDNQTAVARMCSLASSFLLLQNGVEPILQVVTRDRNVLALQSDILGAAALGIRNVLCLGGDPCRCGNHPEAKEVYEISSTQLLEMFRGMRDERKFHCGDSMTVPPQLLLGAAGNPFEGTAAQAVAALENKIARGADFIQTQAIFDLEKFLVFMEGCRSAGLDKKAALIAGIVPLKSFRMAEHMKENVPGIEIPDGLMSRMENASDQKEEGLAIAAEIAGQIREVEGVSGIHIMAVGWEEIIPRLTRRAGFQRL